MTNDFICWKKKSTAMRMINEIIIHCSATPEGRHVTVDDIRRWHKQRGWRDIGYHYAIYIDGSIHCGRPVAQPGAHCKRHNAHSIGICYIGGLDRNGRPKDTRTSAQKASLQSLITRLKLLFPSASIHGHNEFARKACPCFNVQIEY